jgi:drug/metabolite transporter (DMT)-like permease
VARRGPATGSGAGNIASWISASSARWRYPTAVAPEHAELAWADRSEEAGPLRLRVIAWLRRAASHGLRLRRPLGYARVETGRATDALKPTFRQLPRRGPRASSGKALGALAVVGVVVAFSLSSTLVKRADSPGVLVAFWRMVAVSVVWNAVLWSTGRRVTIGNLRQALVPGVFFGLNLAVFFAGATHNSVANAALIGSLSPFLIVPVGAWLFSEYINPRALIYAIVAFAGAALVLLNAPPLGDASLEGNVFGMLAMLLWVAYVAATRHYRQEMDVATFMATISPIAAVAVLPLALAHGDVLGMSSTGWTYMLILTFTSGVAAQGLMVFAQRTIQIGTIGIAQVAQPALAVVWSFLLLGEVLNGWQILGIAIVVTGLLAFVTANRRGERTRQTGEPRKTPIESEGAGATV